MLDSNRFYVYLHRFANGTLYVGKGCAKRAWQFSLNRHNSYWDRLRSKYGAPRVKIISSRMTEPDALSNEVSTIARLRAKGRKLCNRTDGGDGCVGLLISDGTREKLRLASAGESNNMHGKTHTQEARNAISVANKGRFVGSKSGMYNPEILSVINDNTGDVFTGTRQEFSMYAGVPQPRASMLFTGRSASVFGWRLSSTKPEDTGKKGKRHGRYDHTIRHFVHDSGIKETCTKNELGIKYNLPSPSNLTTLCAGRIKSYKGWRLQIIN